LAGQGPTASVDTSEWRASEHPQIRAKAATRSMTTRRAFHRPAGSTWWRCPTLPGLWSWCSCSVSCLLLHGRCRRPSRCRPGGIQRAQPGTCADL